MWCVFFVCFCSPQSHTMNSFGPADYLNWKILITVWRFLALIDGLFRCQSALLGAVCKKQFNSFLNENRYEHLFWLNCISTRLSPITPPPPIYATHSHLHHTQQQRPIYVKWITFNRLINEPIAGLKRNINSFVSYKCLQYGEKGQHIIVKYVILIEFALNAQQFVIKIQCYLASAATRLSHS